MTATLTELQREEEQLWKDNGGSPWDLGEADEGQNDLSRAKIQAFLEEHGEAWLGCVNTYGQRPILVQYTGQLVYNFQYTFVIPHFSAQLVDMLVEREDTPYTSVATDRVLVDAICDRIEELGGVHLHWA